MAAFVPGVAPIAAAAGACSAVDVYTNTGGGQRVLTVYSPDGTQRSSVPLAIDYGDIAVSDDGLRVHGVSFSNSAGATLDTIDVVTGTVTASVVVTGPVAAQSVLNGMSLLADGHLLVGSYWTNQLYELDPATGVSSLSTLTLPAGHVSAGDFTTVDGGDVVALANDTTAYATWLVRLHPDGTSTVVGRVPTSYGMARSGGALYLTGATGDLLEIASVPAAPGTTLLPSTVVRATGRGFYGAASVQDGGSCNVLSVATSSPTTPVGQPPTFTIAGLAPTAAGTVTIASGPGTLCSITLPASSCTPTVSLAVGSYPVTATYSANGQTAGTAFQVVPAPPVPVASVPDAPSGVAARGTGTTATVTFTAPASPGSSPVTGYRVTTTGDGLGTAITTTGPGSPLTVAGLHSGWTYTVTVAASNSVGTGPASDPVAVTWAPPAVHVTPGVTRLAGVDRGATATTVSRALFPVDGRATAAVIATSATYADSLGGSRLASAVHGPLLLTDPAALRADVAAEVHRAVAPGGRIFVLGDTDALSPAVRDALAGLDPTYTTTRLGGADRYATSAAIADTVTRTTAADAPIYLASGVDHPDGLAAAALAGQTGGVVLLTAGPTLPAATAAYLAAHDPTGARTTTVGGPAATAYPRAAHALVGADRYETSALVARQFPAATTTVGIASGADWPDALVGAAAMGVVGGPMLLTEPGALTPAARDVLDSGTHLTASWVFGGPASLSTATEAQVEALLHPAP